jgi:hypothetical protein
MSKIERYIHFQEVIEILKRPYDEIFRNHYISKLLLKQDRKEKSWRRDS